MIMWTDLLDEAVLAGAAPDDCIVWVWQHEACKFSIEGSLATGAFTEHCTFVAHCEPWNRGSSRRTYGHDTEVVLHIHW